MSLVSEFIMTNTKGQSFIKQIRLSPSTVIKSKSLQYTGKIMRFILIPAEFTMSGWNFEYLPFKFLLNIRKMWGQSSCHSYAGEHEACVLLCKLVRNNGGWGILNQTVLQVAQGCPILHNIYVFSPYFSICWIHLNLSRAWCRCVSMNERKLVCKCNQAFLSVEILLYCWCMHDFSGTKTATSSEPWLEPANMQKIVRLW